MCEKEFCFSGFRLVIDGIVYGRPGRLRFGFGNAERDADFVEYVSAVANSYADPNSNSNPYTDANSHSDADTYSDSYTYADSYAHADSHSCSHARAGRGGS